MTHGLSERRLVENEVAFRQANEHIQKNLKQLKQMASNEDNPRLYSHKGKVYFYCECADENCRKRIAISPKKYEELHQNSSQFILIPGHEVTEVERVVYRTDQYEVVEKYNAPPRSSQKLHKTSVDKA